MTFKEFSKKVYRDDVDNNIWGVCSGIAKASDTEVWIVRAWFLLAAFASSGFGVMIYCILALVLPDENEVNPPKKDENPDGIKLK